MSLNEPVSFGVTGLGGYAAFITTLLREQSLSDDPPVRLTAVCEPDLVRHAETAEKFRASGITVVQDYDELLAQPIEAVWLPLPIPLHLPYTARALDAGRAVMCEKPAAGCLQDLDEMRAARDRSGLPVAIGFQDIYKPSTLKLKRALLEGKIGRIKSATLTAYWPRDSRYYARSLWAGRMKQDGAWVMDSPASNALAHFLNLALFLIGDADSSAHLAQVEAELYRVNPIENYDTCALRYLTEDQVSLLVLFSHASAEGRQPRLIIEGDRGRLVYLAGETATLEIDGLCEVTELRPETNVEMVQRFANLLRGIPDERYVATLEIARAHLAAVNGASEATAVVNIGAPYVKSTPTGEGGYLLSVPGIEDLFDRCAAQHWLLSESGLAPWAVAGGRMSLTGYHLFHGPKVSV